jgi:hypothetical protein
MQRILTKALAALALAFTMTLSAQAADANGTWTWTMPGRNGGPDRTASIKLKADGDKLTGEMAPFREGGEPIKITDGKVTGDEVTFKVARPGRNGGAGMSQTYTGKVSGDSIKGKITGKNQQGEDFSRDWEAKRKKE